MVLVGFLVIAHLIDQQSVLPMIPCEALALTSSSAMTSDKFFRPRRCRFVTFFLISFMLSDVAFATVVGHHLTKTSQTSYGQFSGFTNSPVSAHTCFQAALEDRKCPFKYFSTECLPNSGTKRYSFCSSSWNLFTSLLD